MAVTSLDGRAFATFVAAGTYFLRKYRGVVDGLNVFPVPDGDTGANLYLTARAALRGARQARGASLAAVAQAAADGSLLGARGNSGVILSQMLRGFAASVRERDAVDTNEVALALKEAVAAARAALAQPVDGTMITVAERAADEACTLSRDEPDFERLAAALVVAANEALERTPEQLPPLKEAGVVDAGGAGLCYFMEGALRFADRAAHGVTAFPRQPRSAPVFSAHQRIGTYRYCTELVLAAAACDAAALRALLAPAGDSLIVAGTPPTLKLHLHTADPEAAVALAARFGTPERVKVDDMAEQHRLLLVEPPAVRFAVVTVVSGEGFERIARGLGADVTLAARNGRPVDVDDLRLAVNATLAERVYLLPNDAELIPAAREAAGSSAKTVIVVPTAGVVAGLAVQMALSGDADVAPSVLEETLAGVRAAQALGPQLDPAALDERLAATARSLGAEPGSLVTLYYGVRRSEFEAQRAAATLAARIGAEVECYDGGQSDSEYWVSVEA